MRAWCSAVLAHCWRIADCISAAWQLHKTHSYRSDHACMQSLPAHILRVFWRAVAWCTLRALCVLPRQLSRHHVGGAILFFRRKWYVPACSPWSLPAELAYMRARLSFFHSSPQPLVVRAPSPAPHPSSDVVLLSLSRCQTRGRLRIHHPHTCCTARGATWPRIRRALRVSIFILWFRGTPRIDSCLESVEHCRWH